MDQFHKKPGELCTACDRPRKAVASEPINRWFHIVVHRCPNCRTELRMVERRLLPEKHKRTRH